MSRGTSGLPRDPPARVRLRHRHGMLCFSEMPPLTSNPEILFYDGHCALCHGAVKFVLKHDRSGEAFRFAPLQGATFQSRISAGARAALPDSIVVLTEDGSYVRRAE